MQTFFNRIPNSTQAIHNALANTLFLVLSWNRKRRRMGWQTPSRAVTGFNMVTGLALGHRSSCYGDLWHLL